jgi:hypothetical protein
MGEIFVTNTNDFDWQDRFNGEDFFFPKGERVTIPIIAAEHMFGLGRADKTENLVRNGWANSEDGVRKLANFVFTQGIMVEAPVNDVQAALPLGDIKTTIKGELSPA